jgi:hypothetical protein
MTTRLATILDVEAIVAADPAAQSDQASGVIHNLDDGDPELVFFRRVKE